MIKEIICLYLVFYKGYSVMRFDTRYYNANGYIKYGACNMPLEFDYGHNGVWGCGNTPFEAVWHCYKLSKHKKP